MKTYQRAFGIDWKEDEVATFSSGNQSFIAHHSSLSRPSHLQRRVDSNAAHDTESQRIARVRNRCKAQNDALSVWWKAALQSNIKQRMWMQLGPSQTDSSLPPRFERLYQPEKLGQFDRFFTRGWATPVRRSHTSQHTDGPDSEGDRSLIRVISENFTKLKEPEVAADLPPDDDEPLCEFVKKNGFSPPQEPSLQAFLAQNVVTKCALAAGSDFLGRIDSDGDNVRPEYLRYVQNTDDVGTSAQSYRQETVDEFKSCLLDYTLDADDVAGIQKVRDIYRFRCPAMT